MTHPSQSTQLNEDDLARARARLLEELREDGIRDERVLEAIDRVPRHQLVPLGLRHLSYENRPLPIGMGQTISQPYIVALMTQLADLKANERVLEVGTGSGYQAAVLSHLANEIYTLEIVEPLGRRAEVDLKRLGLADKIHFRIGDGYQGWPEAAPFDAILVTAAPREIPRPLVAQLQLGGRLIIPVGDEEQELQVLSRTTDGLEKTDVVPVRFVPMTGQAQRR